MTPMITVVISTFERPEPLERAVRSALEQSLAPVEVLVCDDGSGPKAAAAGRRLEEQHDRVRYLRLPQNTGTPAATRNLGCREARGDWVALLDDDDAWLPHKLRRQAEAIAVHPEVDVIGTNAVRADGSTYFRQDAPIQLLARRDVLRRNPLIVSSALLRRSALLEAGGFVEHRWVAGVADYAAWLALADRGARFLLLNEPLVRYEDAAGDRMSVGRARQERALARLALQRLRRRPADIAQWAPMTRKVVAAAHVSLENLAGVRLHRSAPPAVPPGRRGG